MGDLQSVSMAAQAQVLLQNLWGSCICEYGKHKANSKDVCYLAVSMASIRLTARTAVDLISVSTLSTRVTASKECGGSPTDTCEHCEHKPSGCRKDCDGSAIREHVKHKGEFISFCN